uniref:Uncharacterized protein n=1 Tax=Cacopsylla melanoneura TaxID=428564 RepID=A0A8D8ZJR8_9HEMI
MQQDMVSVTLGLCFTYSLLRYTEHFIWRSGNTMLMLDKCLRCSIWPKIRCAIFTTALSLASTVSSVKWPLVQAPAFCYPPIYRVGTGFDFTFKSRRSMILPY